MAMAENATCNPQMQSVSLAHVRFKREVIEVMATKKYKEIGMQKSGTDSRFTSFHHVSPLQGPPAELSPCLTSLVALAASKLYISYWKWMEMVFRTA